MQQHYNVLRLKGSPHPSKFWLSSLTYFSKRNRILCNSCFFFQIYQSMFCCFTGIVKQKKLCFESDLLLLVLFFLDQFGLQNIACSSHAQEALRAKVAFGRKSPITPFNKSIVIINVRFVKWSLEFSGNKKDKNIFL